MGSSQEATRFAAASARVVAASAADSIPVVKGKVVYSPNVASTTAKNPDVPNLPTIVAVLRQELGCQGSVAEVVTQSAEMLGVATEGSNMMRQAEECYLVLHGKAGQDDDAEVAQTSWLGFGCIPNC